MCKQKCYNSSQQFLIKALNRSRRLFLALPILLVVLMASGNSAQAQTIIKGWSFGAESSESIDVSYSIVQCTPTSGAEMFVQIFNENPAAAQAKFNVVITDPASNQSFTTLVNRSMTVGELLIPDCGSNTLNSLKIPLPSAYDPAAVTVTITFIP